MSEDARSRILSATVTCLGRYGIGKTTVDDVAKEAGLARATVYRHFPDGKDDLIAAAIAWAVEAFFTDLAIAVDDAPDFPSLLERALLHAHRAVEEHDVLQKVAETEPERLLPQLSQSAPLITDAVRVYFERKLSTVSLRPGVTVEEAASWLSRLAVSFVLGGGLWDLSDPEAVRRLVRDERLVGILTPEELDPDR